MSSQADKQADYRINEDTVVEYLRVHPDLLLRHEYLLETLNISHDAGGATSLIEKQVRLLRNQKQQLETQLRQLIEAARNNERIVHQMQRFALEIIRAHSLNDILIVCQETLRNNFKADFVAIKLFAEHDNPPLFLAEKSPLSKSFDTLFENKRTVCGRIGAKQRSNMFGENADKVQSAILTPLQNTRRTGLLAIGSKDPERFHPAMGTLFISYLGELITETVAKHIERN